MSGDSASDLIFTIYAMGEAGMSDGKPVPAEIFIKKMREFLDALKEADKSANNGVKHEYLITDLKKGSAEVTLAERPLDSVKSMPLVSAFDEFEDCIAAVWRHDVPAVKRHNGLLEKITKVTSGAGERFSFIKFERRNGKDYRADRLLHQQALAITREIEEASLEEKPPRLFRGQAADAFDGWIKEVDLRHKTKLCKLVLADGTKELNCEFENFSIEEIRDHLDTRVWAEGMATYDGEQGLPIRFTIQKLRKITPKRDLAKWRGKLAASEPDYWLD